MPERGDEKLGTDGAARAKELAPFAESFDPSSYIKKVGIRFRPEADLLKYVRTNKQLKRVPSELLA